jgi:hypothetical protein
MPSPCHRDSATNLPWPWEVTFRKAYSWHGKGMACVNQTRSHCANQMGKTQSKALAEWHGRGTAWYAWIGPKGSSPGSIVDIFLYCGSTEWVTSWKILQKCIIYTPWRWPSKAWKLLELHKALIKWWCNNTQVHLSVCTDTVQLRVYIKSCLWYATQNTNLRDLKVWHLKIFLTLQIFNGIPK